MFNCSSNAMPSSCPPPCGGSLPRHGTCAGPLPGGYHRPDRYGDNPGQPRPHKLPKIKDPGSHVTAKFIEAHGYHPLGEVQRPVPLAEPSSLPELVTRPIPDRTWSEWYTGLNNRAWAVMDETIGTISGNKYERVNAAGSSTPSPEPGQGGIAMVNLGGLAGQYEKILQRNLDQAAGKRVVRFIDMPYTYAENYPYLRNLAIEAKGTVLTCGGQLHKGFQQTRDQIEAYCRQHGILYRRLENTVNFANIQYLPSKDLLIIASSRIFFFDKNERDELRAAFGNPKNVIHVELDMDKLDDQNGMRCYDLDMGLHLTRNAKAQPVALIYPACIRAHPDLASSGRRDLLLAMHEMGIGLVELSDADQESLAANSVSWGLPPGEILMPSRSISRKLKRDLKAAGMRPSFPEGDHVLGGSHVDHKVGLHCMTLHLPLPSKAARDSGAAPTNPPAPT